MYHVPRSSVSSVTSNAFAMIKPSQLEFTHHLPSRSGTKQSLLQTFLLTQDADSPTLS